MHLPAAARVSRAALERFMLTVPPSTGLTITTMSAIAKPRYSSTQAGLLRPARQRFGVINYVRADTAAEDAQRRWFMFRAVRKFCIQDARVERKVRFQKKTKSLVEGWVWDALKQKIAKRAAAVKST